MHTLWQDVRFGLRMLTKHRIATFLLAQALSSLLFGVQAADPVSFIGLPLLLLAVAGIACYLPARRAAHLDPLQALRHD